MKIRVSVLAASFAALSAVTMASANDVVEMGRAEIDGREVVLLEDGTWRLADTAAADAQRCAGAAEVFMRIAPVSLCLDPATWIAEGQVNHHDAAFVTRDGPELYLGITVGWGDYNNETLRKAILDYARQASGLAELDVRDDEAVALDGADWRRVQFVGPSENGDFMFWNVFRAGPYANVQLLFWTPAGEAEEAEDLVEKVLSSARMNGW